MTARNLESILTSNGFELDMSTQRLGWLIPTDPAKPMDQLWEQYSRQGYLWLKGILDRSKILEFRRRFFRAFQHTGLLMENTDPLEGIYSAGGEKQGEVKKTLLTFVRSAAFESFCLSDKIWQFYEAFAGGDPYLHKRKLLRYTQPFDPKATSAHYDLIYLRGGTENLFTSWIPIGDTPVELGGLIYLEGSDSWAREVEREYRVSTAHLPPDERISAYNTYMNNSIGVSKNLPALADLVETRWLVADYEAGDMVVHSPYMVHASTTNIDLIGRMRLSTDIRYQRVQDEIDVRWQNHWSLDDML